MNQDLKIIKKKYGEKMAHLCRDLFSTILDESGKLSNLMVTHFDENHELYDDIVNNDLIYQFKNYIYSFINEKQEDVSVDKTPAELLDEAGYTLYECHSESDIQNFKKYYSKGEELCTFNGGRLNNCHVFFAIKKDVDEIKRSDFKEPKRQDRYGTSVISIQFTKDDNHTLSIKNRYNHAVNNPDATFSNNLELIIPGLTKSFENTYGLKQKYAQNILELPGYVFIENKYYKYNLEINNVYYCPGNVIIDNGRIMKYDKEKYLVMDYFVLDLVNKTISPYDVYLNDSFVDGLSYVNKITINKYSNQKDINILIDDDSEVLITVDKDNNIIGYKNNNIEVLGDYFLTFNKKLTNLELDNVKEIGKNVLVGNESIKRLFLPKVNYIDNYFLFNDYGLEQVSFPNLVEVGSYFLALANLVSLRLPNLKTAGDNFLSDNIKLVTLEAPKLEYIGECFLSENKFIEDLSLPNVLEIGEGFLRSNKILKSLSLPKVRTIEKYSLINANDIKDFYAPNLLDADIPFLNNNKAIR